jgi:hypothetical protein
MIDDVIKMFRLYRHRLSAQSMADQGKRNAASLVCHVGLQGVQEKICRIDKITIIWGKNMQNET